MLTFATCPVRIAVTGILFLLIAGCTPSNNKNVESRQAENAGIYYYEPYISTISGIVCKKSFYGPPGFGEDENQIPDTGLVIALQNSIAVLNLSGVDTTDPEAFENEYNVDTIQLNVKAYKLLRGIAGHSFQLKGVFYHADNGHHFTNVLLIVSEVRDSAGVLIWRAK